MANETWVGWSGLYPYDRDKLFIALRAAHLPCFKGGDVVIANSMDFAMLNDIMHSCSILKVPGKFRAVAFSDAEIADLEKQLSLDPDTEFKGHGTTDSV